tara:strand:+ start:127 stop:648 length:522 start_codon:yes stop_codon:yes gene_type:complete
MAKQTDERYKRAFLALGSNQGKRIKELEEARRLIQNDIGEIVNNSSIYETEAWGNSTLLPFLNQVIEISSTKSPERLLLECLRIENKMGRIRTKTVNSYENRVIDIDVLLFEDKVISSPKLTLPHPKLHLRKFVLLPLSEIAPNFKVSVYNLTVKQLLEKCEDNLEVVRFQSN